jgi:hypothetical protein
MLMTIRGVFRGGRVELTETPHEVDEETPVIVTFLQSGPIDLRSRGIDKVQAADLRERMRTFADDWESPEMDIYDDYDGAKSRMQAR